MLNSEVGSTRTAAGGFGGGPPIPQGQGVNKGALVERKAMFFQRPSSQPALPRKVHGPLEGGSELIPQVICVGDGLLAPPPLYLLGDKTGHVLGTAKGCTEMWAALTCYLYIGVTKEGDRR